MTFKCPTLAEMQATKRATPKASIEPRMLSKEKQRKAKKANDDTFRAGVWARDGGRCRATGVSLSKSGTDWKKVGEVDHTLLKSTNPDRVYDIENGVLMQKWLNRLRKVHCRHAPEFLMFDYDGIDEAARADRGLPQRFTWRDENGQITREEIG